MDQQKLEAFVHQVAHDTAAAFTGVLVHIGYQLGLYEILEQNGPMSAKALAEKAGAHPRYIAEWAANQVASGFITYHSDDETFSLSEEQAMVFANPDSPVYLVAAYDTLSAMWLDEDKFIERMKNGSGFGWHEHHHRLFSGTEALFRPGYKTHLTTDWIPAMNGTEAKLKNGALVADVGCGHGASTIVMAQAYPNSTFIGYDNHQASIDTAKKRARQAGVDDRVTFETATAKDYPQNNYDLICYMDCLHDMGDPVGAAKHAREALNDDGSVLLVEPFAGANLEANCNPVGRLFYAASTMFCTAHSLSEEVGLALGAQAGEHRLGEVFNNAGFTQFRRVAETPFNLILEARV